MHPVRSTLCWRALVLSLLLAMPAAAQVIERPPRSTGGLLGGNQPFDPNRTRTELVLTMDALGGWDDDVIPFGAPVSPQQGFQQSGYLGIGSAALRYFRGHASRSIETTGRGYTTAYPSLNISPLTGGEAAVIAQSTLGRRNRVTATAAAEYSPTLILAAFGPVEAAVDSGVVSSFDPTRGLTRTRSLSRGGTVSLDRDWTTRQRTNARYDIQDLEFFSGPELDSVYQLVQVGHIWDFSRSAGFNLTYRHSHQRLQESEGPDRPTRAHTGELGLDVRRAVSRTRNLSVGVRGGATSVRAVGTFTDSEYEYTAPTAAAMARFDLGRTWALSGDYRRDVNILEGLVLQSFFTDAASLTLGGNLGTRIATAVSAAYSQGRARGTDEGSYENLVGTAQVRYAVSRCCSLLTSYTYYRHHLRDLETVPDEFPERFERNALRMGVTITLPLYGTFSPRTGIAANGN